VKNGSADKIIQDTTANANGLYRTIITNYRIGTELKLQIDGSGSDTIFNFHGISFENPSLHGLQYNRCGVVGATFLQLVAQQDFTLAQLKETKPDLIIFSYGSNESYDKNFNIDDYYKRVSQFIIRIKNEIPGVNIIFTDTPDTRSRNRYPANTIPINEKLKLIATETGSGFWDLNTIMGGDNSMMYWLKNNLTRKDQLHFTKAGYELQGNLFSSAFLDVYNKNNNSEKNQTVQRVCDSLHAQIETQLKDLTAKNDSINSAANNSTTNTSHPANTKVHAVQKNETLGSIAKKYGVSVKQLCEWNGLTEKSVLHIDQKIVIKK
jgi:LysM repeat protein